uniref:Glypican-1 n=1 Tax=Panagrolaimus davidi TaxID=227884 RepID=A0A914PT89_9BILA
MNPLRNVNELEKDCMNQIQTDLKPFGNLPQKISLLMERSFIAWKTILKTLDQANEILFKLLDVVISPQCINQLTKMQQCHVCSGSSPLSKPCSGYCLNVLKGCFAEMAEIDPQWNSMIG